MKFWQDHPKAATAVVVLIGLAATLFLVIVSRTSGPAGLKKQVLAHGNSGAVVAGEGQGAYTSIQNVDFHQVLSSDLGDGKTIKSTSFGDINGDGLPEALVVVADSGDDHPIDWYLFSLSNGQPDRLFERHQVANGDIGFEGPRLVEREGVYAPGDAECCPSSMKQTFYVWKGDALVVSQVEAGAPAPAP